MKNYHFYTSSIAAWKAMSEAIEKAKSSIYWESYVFVSNYKNFNFFDQLAAKAKQGVKVKLIIDSFGSFFINQNSINKLKESGVELLFYNRLLPWWNPNRFKYWWFHRNHKKILIVDEKVAFVGGVNVGKIFHNWNDLQVELRGVIVRYLLRSFAVSYNLSGGGDKLTYPAVFVKDKIRVFHHSPLTERGILKNYYKRALKTAKKSLVIVTPYFFPQAWFIKLTHRALDRGVKITVLLPAKSNYRLLDMANFFLASLVYKPGIRFFFTKKMNHAKAFLVDGREAMVGSQNIDAYSFDYNLEGGIVFSETNMINDLKKIIDDWKNQSVELNLDYKKKWYQKLAIALALFFSSYL